jgi:hypothetical protein
LQPDTITPGGSQGLNRYSYVNNNPLLFVDPSGHKWACTGDLDDHCFDDGDFAGGDGGLSGMAKNKSKKVGDDQYSWQRIVYNMEKLNIYGDSQAAMEYVTRSECTKATCYSSDSPLFKAMMHKYNSYCGGGNTWSMNCVQSFWGYPQGILTGDTGGYESNSSTENMAVAICSGPQKLDTTLRGRIIHQERGPLCPGNAGVSMPSSKQRLYLN